MKKTLILLSIATFLSTSIVISAQKYKVNTSGVIKNRAGQRISSPAYTTNQNYYNNYQANNYIANNEVNAIPVNTIEIVMDYSGSMYNWIEVAKRSMASIISQIPQTTKVGFRVFGHDFYGSNKYTGANIGEVKQIIKKGKKFKVVTKQSCIGRTNGSCGATEQVAPIVSVNSNTLLAGMNSVNIGGSTPLVFALDRTVNQDFITLDRISPKKIILITDGGENCGGDPCAFAQNLMKKRNDIHIDVVLVSSSSRALACLSETTGGNYYNIENLADFSNTLTNSIKNQPKKIENQKQHFEFIGE